MAFDEKLKAKSEKNWECVELLQSYQPKHFDVAASRLYYSIFLLIKSNMVENAKDENKPIVCKMSADAATKPHRLVVEYIKWLDEEAGRQLRNLQDLRNIADYEPKPVTEEAFNRQFEFWTKWKNDFLSKHSEP